MQTIVIKLNPTKLENPDLDLRYLIPDRIEEISHGKISGNGYDYLNDAPGTQSSLGIWFETESAKENFSLIVDLFHTEKFIDNDLFLSAEIYISENEAEDIENCTLVFPK